MILYQLFTILNLETPEKRSGNPRKALRGFQFIRSGKELVKSWEVGR